MAIETGAIVARLIFRFDFGVSHEFMDRQGHATKILQGSDADYWQLLNVGGGQKLEVRRVEPDYAATLAFEPATVHGSLESAVGLSLGEILDHEIMKKWNDAVRGYFDAFKVSLLNRAGIRFIICVGDRSESDQEKLLTLNEQDETALPDNDLLAIVGEPFASALTKTLGRAVGSELLFFGEHEDGIGSRLAVGRLQPDRLKRVLGGGYPQGSLQEMAAARKFLLDLDLFEANFSFSEHGLYRWSKSKLPKVNSICEMIEGLPAGHHGTSDTD